MDGGSRLRQRLRWMARRPWAVWGVLAVLAASPVQAATFGHARLASSAGQPLVIVVPVTGLTAADAQSLSARAAPAAAWAQAGLTPPVALDSLAVTVTPGVGTKTDRTLRIHSSQAFSGSLADVLLDVQTTTGSQRYQVSLVGPGPARGTAAGAAAQNVPSRSHAAVGAAPAAARRAPMARIRVRPGDTMMALAGQHPVRGVSIYQLMLALQRANPQAFIHQNINLVRAGTTLGVPSVDDMLSISDAEARRQFMAQAAAFDRLRGRAAAAASSVQAGQGAAGAVSAARSHERATPSSRAHDRLRLSEGRGDRADARTARGHALKDAESRVDQLRDNVQNLNQALQVQGEAARSVAADGANVIGSSIQKIAGAISQASHEAAAQAADRVADASTPRQAGSDASAVETTASAGVPGRAVATAGQAAGASGQASTSATGTPGSPAGSSAGSGQAPAGQVSTAHDPLFGATGDTPASQAKAHANAEAAELHASEQTRHRVNWLQDHLLGVMTALLALIVFIIAWLLRRANAARDEADADPRVTEAMVQEKLQGIDLNLPPAEPRAPSSDA